MKRFLLFGGNDRYPHAGWHDYQGSYDTLKDAAEKGAASFSGIFPEFWHVVDAEIGEIVKAHDGVPEIV